MLTSAFSLSAGTKVTSQKSQDFFLGPFLFQSELDLPELHGVSGSGIVVVAIRVGTVPVALPEATIIDPYCQVTSTAYLLDIPDVARFLAQDGRTVTVELFPSATLANVTTYLLGSVFGALCHQNGFLPLHASAVMVDGNVTAFLGDSGAGKSTFAAFLGRRGHTIVSDDICLIDLRASAGDTLPVIPVAVWLKLWRQSIDQFGENPEEANRIFSKEDKFRVYLTGGSPAESMQPHLRNLVFLERPSLDDSSEITSLDPLVGALALSLLMDTIYMNYLVEATGQLPHLFQLCSRVLNRAKAFRLLAPRQWEHIHEGLELVERDLLRPTSR